MAVAAINSSFFCSIHSICNVEREKMRAGDLEQVKNRLKKTQTIKRIFKEVEQRQMTSF